MQPLLKVPLPWVGPSPEEHFVLASRGLPIWKGARPSEQILPVQGDQGLAR